MSSSLSLETAISLKGRNRNACTASLEVMRLYSTKACEMLRGNNWWKRRIRAQRCFKTSYEHCRSCTTLSFELSPWINVWRIIISRYIVVAIYLCLWNRRKIYDSPKEWYADICKTFADYNRLILWAFSVTSRGNPTRRYGYLLVIVTRVWHMYMRVWVESRALEGCSGIVIKCGHSDIYETSVQKICNDLSSNKAELIAFRMDVEEAFSIVWRLRLIS